VLYGKAIEVLLMTWNVETHEAMEQDEAIPQLAFVAFTMMKDGIQRISSKRLQEILNLARKQMPEVLSYARHSVAEFIKRVEYRSSLLMLSGHEVEDGTLYPMYEFRHLTFQEYLTARAIVEGYYPGCKDDDTLLSVLEPHLEDTKWKEVVALATVLAGRKVQPLVQNLIERCKKLDKPHLSPQFPVVLLSRCILDEIQLAPKLLEEALEWIARRVNPPSLLILSLFEGRYGEVLLKVVRDAYISSDTDMIFLGGALGDIHIHRMGGTGGKAPTPQIFEMITNLLDNENALQKAIGALTVSYIAYHFSIKKLSSDSIKRLKALGDRIVSSLYSDISYLHFASCFALRWLAETETWTPKQNPDVLSRLLDLWKNSPLFDVQYMASLTISTLSIIDRKQKPLPEPDPDSINFIKEQLHNNEYASLIMAFYWKKPWTDEELLGMVDRVKGGFRWKRNKSLILKALERGKERA
jgi:hypothetical protein